jgi:hypothetical protein
MYIIEEGRAYFVKGKKAYAISFNLDKKMSIDEEESIDVKNQPKYSYDIMYRKLNIDYMIEQEKASQGDNAKLYALKKENEELTAKVKELKALADENEALKAEIEELKALIEKEPSKEPNGEPIKEEPKGEEDVSKEEPKKLNKEDKK